MTGPEIGVPSDRAWLNQVKRLSQAADPADKWTSLNQFHQTIWHVRYSECVYKRVKWLIGVEKITNTNNQNWSGI